VRPSSTTSHGRVVSRSQLTKRSAAASAFPESSPSITVAASPYVDSTAAMFVADTQTSTSTLPVSHSHWVAATASWVLPQGSRQLSLPEWRPAASSVSAPAATRATAAPGFSAVEISCSACARDT
jgi:hypothetical protein